MSAYIVADRTINTIVSHIYLNHELDWLKREFMDAIGPHEKFCASLGDALFHMNIEAVESRYGEGEARKFRSLDYEFRLEAASVRQVYDDIKCLQYQCAEGDVPDTVLFKLLIELRAAVADEIIVALEPAAMTWGNSNGDHWDVLTSTTDGVIWRRYGDRKIVVARIDETPQEALARVEREEEP